MDAEPIKKQRVNFMLRVDPDLVEDVRELAEKHKMSVNQVSCLLLRMAVDAGISIKPAVPTGKADPRRWL